jgi:hypothetical protein
MKTHFPRHAVIALLALVPLLAGAVAVYAQPNPTPPSAPLGDGVTTNNSLAQRVVLYEEEPGNPQGKRATGSVVWTTESDIKFCSIRFCDVGFYTQQPGIIRADINIPDRKMEISWRLRRTTGLGISTSHIMELLFKLPPDFASGGIFNVPGIWMKQAEQTQGTALAGLAVKVKPGYFLIGLSNAPADRKRNIQLLKERPWINIPIVYTNNRRAILAMEKGTDGEQAFQHAFAAWEE